MLLRIKASSASTMTSLQVNLKSLSSRSSHSWRFPVSWTTRAEPTSRIGSALMMTLSIRICWLLASRISILTSRTWKLAFRTIQRNSSRRRGTNFSLMSDLTLSSKLWKRTPINHPPTRNTKLWWDRLKVIRWGSIWRHHHKAILHPECSLMHRSRRLSWEDRANICLDLMLHLSHTRVHIRKPSRDWAVIW